jgi:hypothetical protein
MEMSAKEFMNLSDSEIKDRYLDLKCYDLTNFYLLGRFYTHGKSREIKLKKPYPTIEVDTDGDTTTKTSRSIVTITYKTKKMRLIVETVDIDKLSNFKIEREGYDSRYTADRDS